MFNSIEWRFSNQWRPPFASLGKTQFLTISTKSAGKKSRQNILVSLILCCLSCRYFGGCSNIYLRAKSNLCEVNEKEDNYLMTMGLKARQTRVMSFCTQALLARKVSSKKSCKADSSLCSNYAPTRTTSWSSCHDLQDDKDAREDTLSCETLLWNAAVKPLWNPCENVPNSNMICV